MSTTDLSVRTAAINAWDAGFQTLVKRTVLKPKEREATSEELALLAEHAIRTGLDPMSRQIYGIYRKSKGVEQMTLQVGIDGLRTIAERTNRYIGQAGPFWCGTDRVWHEVWLESTPPIAAKVLVRKIIGGHIAETPAVAHYAEYVPTYNGKPLGLWPEKPALMLAKCAEALALRKAFPHDMAGLYIEEEMERADAAARSDAIAARPQPAAEPPNINTTAEPAGEAIPDADVIAEHAAPGDVIDDERSTHISLLIHEAIDAGVLDPAEISTIFAAAGVHATALGQALTQLSHAQADQVQGLIEERLPTPADMTGAQTS